MFFLFYFLIFIFRFYLNKYSGRMLIFQFQLGLVDLNVIFYGQKKDDAGGVGVGFKELRKYIMQVFIYQMCILMFFNKSEKWIFEVWIFQGFKMRDYKFDLIDCLYIYVLFCVEYQECIFLFIFVKRFL